MFVAIGAGPSRCHKHLMGVHHLLFRMTLEAISLRHLDLKRLILRPAPGKMNLEKPEAPDFRIDGPPKPCFAMTGDAIRVVFRCPGCDPTIVCWFHLMAGETKAGMMLKKMPSPYRAER